MTQTNGQDAQTQVWNGAAGEAWVSLQTHLDQLFAGFETRLAEAVAPQAAQQVLDVGCGTGATVLATARRLGADGHCLGVDLSRAMIERARQRAASAELPASFEIADAQAMPHRAQRFDRIQSRFGVMFFADPVAGFARLRQLARPGGELHAMTWRERADNPFMTLANQVAAPLVPELPVPQPGAPGQFALADPVLIRNVLAGAGWQQVSAERLDQRCTMPASALETYVTRMGALGRVWNGLDVARQQRLRQRLLEAFEPFVSLGQVQFTAACWEIKARA